MAQNSMKYPRRLIALGPPYDDGTLPGVQPTRPQARFTASPRNRAGSNLQALLGPVPCQGCRTLVWWGRSNAPRVGGRRMTWREVTGRIHRCRGQQVDKRA